MIIDGTDNSSSIMKSVLHGGSQLSNSMNINLILVLFEAD
jgi:hypothetical protein